MRCWLVLTVLVLALGVAEGATFVGHYSVTLLNNNSTTFTFDKYIVNVSDVKVHPIAPYAVAGLDNSGGGAWKVRVAFPLESPLADWTNFKIVVSNSTLYLINGSNILKDEIYCPLFWEYVNKTWLTDLRVFNQSSELPFWIMFPKASNTTLLTINTTAGIYYVSHYVNLPHVVGKYVRLHFILVNSSTAPASVRVYVNGVPITTVPLPKSVGGYTVEVPTSDIVQGMNNITYEAVGSIDKAYVRETVLKYVSDQRNITIWVKATAGTDVINLAWGNPKASKSVWCNGSRTFIFFDDFTGTTLNWSTKVVATTSTTTGVGYAYVLDGDMEVYSLRTAGTGNYVYYTYVNITNLTSFALIFSRYSIRSGLSCGSSLSINAVSGYVVHQQNQLGNYFAQSNGSAVTSGADVGDGSDYKLYEIIYRNGVSECYVDNHYVYDITGTPPSLPFYTIYIGANSWGNAVATYVDFIFVARINDNSVFGEPKIVSTLRLKVNINTFNIFDKLVDVPVLNTSKTLFAGSYIYYRLFNVGVNSINITWCGLNTSYGDAISTISFNYTYVIPQHERQTEFDAWLNTSEFYVPFGTVASELTLQFETVPVANYRVTVYVNGKTWTNYTYTTAIADGERRFQFTLYDLPCGDPTVSIHVVYPAYVNVRFINENTLTNLTGKIVNVTLYRTNFSVIKTASTNTSSAVLNVTNFSGEAFLRAEVGSIIRQLLVNITAGYNTSVDMYIPTANIIPITFHTQAEGVVLRKYVGSDLVDIDWEKVTLGDVATSYVIANDPYYVYVVTNNQTKYVGIMQFADAHDLYLDVTSATPTEGAVSYSIENQGNKIVVSYATYKGVTTSAELTITRADGTVAYHAKKFTPNGVFVFYGREGMMYLVHLKVNNDLHPIDVTVPVKIVPQKQKVTSPYGALTESVNSLVKVVRSASWALLAVIIVLAAIVVLRFVL